MDAVLSRYRGKKVLDIFYSTATDGHNWNAMSHEARRICGLGDEPCCIIFTPQRLRDVLRD
jgi:hypothetical protein